MQGKEFRLPWFGLGLVLFGTLLLLRRLGFVYVAFGQLFWGLVMLWGIASVRL